MRSAIPKDAAGLAMLNRMPRESIRVLDVETTGLDPERDEILQIAVLDGNGDTMFSSLIKPARRKRWDRARKLHGISPADVAGSPTFAEAKPDIEKALDGAEMLVGHNLAFDMAMMRAGGFRFSGAIAWKFDTMTACTQLFGEWSSYYGSKKRVDLARALYLTGAERVGSSHDAVSDARAALSVYDLLIGRYIRDRIYLGRIETFQERKRRIEEAAIVVEPGAERKEVERRTAVGTPGSDTSRRSGRRFGVWHIVALALAAWGLVTCVQAYGLMAYGLVTDGVAAFSIAVFISAAAFLVFYIKAK